MDKAKTFKDIKKEIGVKNVSDYIDMLMEKCFMLGFKQGQAITNERIANNLVLSKKLSYEQIEALVPGISISKKE